MNSLERLYRARHLDEALAQVPVKGSAVREAHDELAKLTDELTRARDRFEQARGAARDCAARVRDATVTAKAECKKGRGALIARGVEVVEAPEGSSRRSLMERCEQLLGQGRNQGVKLAELSVARDALASRIAQLVEADSRRKSASRDHRAVGRAWEGAYSALRAIVEGTLRRTGLRGDLLDEVLERYFPSRVERSSTPERSPAPRASLPAGASGTEGTKAA